MALRSGRAIVWSPPSATRRSARPNRSVAAASIAPTASTMSNGLQAISPASATWWARHGSTSRAGWYGRRSFDPARIADGPKRAPLRYDTPESNGTPTTATAASPTSSRRGNLANVSGPANRGTTRASGGPTGLRSRGLLTARPRDARGPRASGRPFRDGRRSSPARPSRARRRHLGPGSGPDA